ncbi:hypothetical protein [Salidesulfovibrio brasiliensis]|uniref:hypothetical protein n=1 Tax=Salidesulfovibrio brasiliensis TaxID=221711 RepID=UPI0006D2494E|nr:hypothetical protein [Salidesulfovibrio brasiliensis]
MKPKLDIKEKAFYAIMLIGALAGLVEGTIAHGFSLRYLFPGAILAISAAFVGGLAGFIIKDASRVIRGMKPYRGVHYDGMVLGGMTGTLLGTLVQVAGSADGANLVVGSVVGSFIGSMAGTFPDEFVTPMIELLHKDNDDRLEPSEQHQ